MKSNKEKFLELVSKEKTSSAEKIKASIKSRAVLRESQNIAIKILSRLDELSWTQKDLAEKMGVSPQQVNKIVRGKENLTLDTQIKLQSILGIPILASYYEDKGQSTDSDQDTGFAIEEVLIEDYKIQNEPVRMMYDYASEKYTSQKLVK